MSRDNVVWLSTSATTFSCLCELCLSTSEVEGTSFLEAIRDASVRGTFAADADVLFARCSAGHRVVLRRIERPPKLARSDARQLQLA